MSVCCSFEGNDCWGKWKTGVLGEKPIREEERTNNKFDPLASTLGFKHGPHWCEVHSPMHHP